MISRNSLLETTQSKIQNGLDKIGDASRDIKIFFNLQTEEIDQTWKISKSKIFIQNSNINSNKFLYSYRIKHQLWKKFLFKETNYDNIALGGHLKIYQGKMGYNSLFHRMMRYLHSDESLKILGEFYLNNKNENNEHIKIKINDKIFKIKKYCPHQKYDLTTAKIKNKCVLVCPAHNWEFDIITGNCIKGDPNANIKFIEKEKLTGK